MNEIIELIKNGKNEQLEKRIIEEPEIANLITEQGISLLQFAAYCRNEIAIKVLAKYKKALNIFEAVCTGDHEIVIKSLDSKPELLNSFSADGFTALGLASFFGHISIVKALLKKNADPNIASSNSFKVAPIHSACAISNFEIVELLIQNGADVNAKQMQGVTPLHSSAHSGQLKIVKILIDNSADINAIMDNGQTPLIMASEKNFQEVVDFLILHGAV